MIGQRGLVTLAIGTALALTTPVPAPALPLGRSWAPTTELSASGVRQVGSPRFELDSEGQPWLFTSVLWDSSTSGKRWAALGWADSSWIPRAVSDIGAYTIPEFGLARSAARHMVVLDEPPASFRGPDLVICELTDSTIATPDTVLRSVWQSSEFSSAASRTRRWAVRSENRQGGIEDIVRTAYSDSTGRWHEVAQIGVDEDHNTIAPLDDATAMVVYAGQSGLQWAVLDGATWTATGNLDSRPFNASHPRFRFQPGGGLLLLWADLGWMHVSRYRNGVWERGDSTRAQGAPGETFVPGWLDATRDSTERPTLIWGNLGYGFTYRDHAVIALPNESGWDPGEEIPGADQVYLTPSIAKDRNGDLWVAWRRRDFTTRWTHTYVSATCDSPRVIAGPVKSRIEWTLSSPAPASRWTVLRESVGSAPIELATLTAGAEQAMSFDDTTARPGVVWRYRIRRESLDARYRFESATSSGWFPDTARDLGLRITTPARGSLTFTVSGAGGTLVSQLHDLQGRLAMKQLHPTNSTGEDSYSLDIGRLGSVRQGVYFLRVLDSTGRASPPRKVVILP